MKLDIQIELSGSQNPDGTWPQPTASYKHLGSVPPSPDAIDASGNIDLTKMNRSVDYNDATRIDFRLDATNMTDRNGRPAKVKFVSDLAKAIVFTEVPSASGSGASSPEGASSFSPPEGSTRRPGSILSFRDEDRDGKTYSYCLKVNCAEAGASEGTEVDLDPRIVNRAE